MRMRITIRGEGTELRGYATMEALVTLTAPPGGQPYMVIASPADDDYDPFQIDQPDNPPSIELSREIIQGMWDASGSPEEFLATMAHLHMSQAEVIRGERFQKEKLQDALDELWGMAPEGG